MRKNYGSEQPPVEEILHGPAASAGLAMGHHSGRRAEAIARRRLRSKRASIASKASRPCVATAGATRPRYAWRKRSRRADRGDAA